MKTLRPLFILLLLVPFASGGDQPDPGRDLERVVKAVRQGMKKLRLTEETLRPQHDFLPADAWRLPLVEGYLAKPLTIPGDSFSRFGGFLHPAAGISAELETAGRSLGLHAGEAPEKPPAKASLEESVLGLFGLAGGAAPPSREELRKTFAAVPKKARAPLASLLAEIAHSVKERTAAFEKISDVEWVRLRQYGSQFNTGIPVNMQADFLTGLHARIDRDRIYAAALRLTRRIEETLPALADGRPAKGPSFHIALDTPAGRIEIGGYGPDRYAKDCLFAVDLGGDDVYENSAGGTLYTPKKISVCLDLAGDDIYRTEVGLAQGSGMYGIGILVDAEGDDFYEAKNVSQGAGHVGVGILWDRAGDDRYVARSVSQGAGFQGIGMLVDEAGRDVYRIGLQGQGLGLVQGFGLLQDRAGNDSYRAGGLQPDRPREPDRFLSMAQGFAIGTRAEDLRLCASGGIGVLADARGDDSYEADVFGQGAAYWYALGILLDGEGRDFYDVHNYGQGAGFHMAVGALLDLAGDDRYHGRGHALGHGLDRSVGFFADLAGDDLYDSGDSESQGVAVKPFALGIFADLRGDDTYRGGGNGSVRPPPAGQEAESPKAFFLDFEGTDTYPLAADGGSVNGRDWIRARLGWGRDR